MLIREWLGLDDRKAWRMQHHRGGYLPFNLHYHPEFELTLTQGARGLRYLGNETEEFPALDLVLVAPNQPHSWSGEPIRPDDAGNLVIFFRLDWLMELTAQGLPELRPLVRWLQQVGTAVVFSPEFIVSMLPQFEALKAAQGMLRVTVMLGILARLMDDTQARFLAGGVTAAKPADRRLQAAMQHLTRHYTEPLALAELARVAATSETTLKRLFADEMQTTFTTLLQQLRISHACNLLLTTRQSNESIAQASGFPTVSLFYRQFEKQKGQSPAAYRRALLK